MLSEATCMRGQGRFECVYKVKGRGELRSRYWRLQEVSGEEHAKACDRGGQEGEEGEVQRQREGRAGSKLLHTSVRSAH